MRCRRRLRPRHPGDLYSYAVPRRGFANERPAYAIRVLEAAAVRGALTLSIGYCRSDLDPAVPEGILDRMVAELRAFAA